MQINTVLTKKQAAEILCMSVQTIDKLIKNNGLPKVQLSVRRIGIMKSDIDAYLTAQRSKGGAV